MKIETIVRLSSRHLTSSCRHMMTGLSVDFPIAFTWHNHDSFVVDTGEVDNLRIIDRLPLSLQDVLDEFADHAAPAHCVDLIWFDPDFETHPDLTIYTDDLT